MIRKNYRTIEELSELYPEFNIFPDLLAQARERLGITPLDKINWKYSLEQQKQIVDEYNVKNKKRLLPLERLTKNAKKKVSAQKR